MALSAPPKLDGAGLRLERREGQLDNSPEPELVLQTWPGYLIFGTSVPLGNTEVWLTPSISSTDPLELASSCPSLSTGPRRPRQSFPSQQQG